MSQGEGPKPTEKIAYGQSVAPPRGRRVQYPPKSPKPRHLLEGGKSPKPRHLLEGGKSSNVQVHLLEGGSGLEPTNNLSKKRSTQQTVQPLRIKGSPEEAPNKQITDKDVLHSKHE